MADAEAFEAVCALLEARTSLDRLAARGTVRIALKQAGLDARTVTPEQMAVVADKVLVGELTSRGIGEAGTVCRELVTRLRAMTGVSAGDTPDTVFRRLGG